jgi:hypothetical protein
MLDKLKTETFSYGDRAIELLNVEWARDEVDKMIFIISNETVGTTIVMFNRGTGSCERGWWYRS